MQAIVALGIAKNAAFQFHQTLALRSQTLALPGKSRIVPAAIESLFLPHCQESYVPFPRPIRRKPGFGLQTLLDRNTDAIRDLVADKAMTGSFESLPPILAQGFYQLLSFF